MKLIPPDEPFSALKSAAMGYRRRQLLYGVLLLYGRHKWRWGFSFLGALLLCIWWGPSQWVIFPFLGLIVSLLLATYIIHQSLGGLLDSLAHWDEERDLNDLFSNAWQFVKDESALQKPSVAIHLAQMAKRLPQEREGLKTWLKIPWQHFWHLLGVVILGGVFIFALPKGDWNSEPQKSEEPLEVSIAQGVAKNLKFLGDQDVVMSKATAEDVAQLHQQQSQLKDLSQKLEQGKFKGVASAMEAVESVAAAIESLGKSMQISDQEWMSVKMIQYFKEAVFTQEFASEVEVKNLKGTHVKTSALFEIFRAENSLKTETQELVDRLEKLKSAVDEGDEKRLISQFLIRISEQLTQGLKKESAATFEELLDRLFQMIQREENRQKLAELSEKVRQQGGKLGNPSSESTSNAGKSTQGDGTADTVKGDAPVLSQEMMAPPVDVSSIDPQENQALEISTEQGEPPALATEDPSSSQKAEEGKKKAKFFAPVPGMTEEQAKNLSQGFQLEGKMQNDQNPGATTADLQGEESQMAGANSLQKLKGLQNQGGEGSRVHAVDQTKVYRETAHAELGQEEQVRDKEKERALNLDRIPANQRGMVREYFIQLRKQQAQGSFR